MSSSHDPTPESRALYLPLAHAMHKPPSAVGLEYLPLAQAVQSDKAVACAPEDLPSSHSMHVSTPSAALYLPATHASHNFPFKEAFPLAQAVHAVSAVARAPEDLPATQSVHLIAPVVTALYWPASQSVQLDSPAAAENFPASQSSHVAARAAPGVEEDLPATQRVHVPLAPSS